VTLGGTSAVSLPAQTPTTSPSAFLAKLDGVGNPLWGRSLGVAVSFGDNYGSGTSSVAVNAAGDTFFAGTATNGANVGGGAISVSGTGAALLAKYTTDGKYAWAKTYGGTTGAMGAAVAVDAAGNVVLAGAFTDSIDFGSGGALALTGASHFL